MNERTRLKTRSRLSNFYKTNHSIKTDKGQLLFRIDSPGSVPQDQESARSEPETFEWIKNHLKVDEVMWDIGANVGMYTIFAAIFSEVKVFSFEPEPNNFRLLRKCVEKNYLSYVFFVD